MKKRILKIGDGPLRKLPHAFYRKNRPALFAATLVLAATTALLVPHAAYATTESIVWEPDSWGNNILRLIESFLLNVSCCFFGIYSAIVGDIKADTGLTTAFSSILGKSMYSITETVHQSAVIPIGHAVLGLFMLVQLIKISQKIDATATLPAVKEIVFLVVIYCIMSWMIDNSLQIISAIYDLVVTNIIPHIGKGGTASSGIGSITMDDIDLDKATVGGSFVMFLCSMVTVLVGLIAYIVAFIVAYARAWQIYIYAAFSPIPISLLGFEETKQMGIGFLKNICAACLAGAVMLFILVAYPYLVEGIASNVTSDALANVAYLGDDSTTSIAAIEALLLSVGSGILLIYSLVKSGAWAKEILGA